jgi:hypothetical protein
MSTSITTTAKAIPLATQQMSNTIANTNTPSAVITEDPHNVTDTTTNTHSASYSGSATGFDAFPARLLAYNDFIRAIGQQQLNSAQAELYEAQAAHEMERVQLLSDLVGQLETDLYNLNQQQANLADQYKKIVFKAHYAEHFLSGRELYDYNGVVDAYKFFEKSAKLEIGDALYTAITPENRAKLGKANYIHNDSKEPVENPPDEALENSLTLINWCFEKHYYARSGSFAELIFMHLYQAIAAVAQESLKNIDSLSTQLRSNVFTTWNPMTIITADSTAVDKQIAARATAVNPAASSPSTNMNIGKPTAQPQIMTSLQQRTF